MPDRIRVRGAIVALVALLGLIAPPAAARAQQQDQGQAPAGPQLDARAWILVDARDGTELAGGDTTRSLPVASTTKLMTAYLTLEELPLGEIVTAPGYSALPAESVLGLQAGEKISVRDLLTAMMLPSANDAAFALARTVSGSVPAFVARMNAAAERLGLEDTTYANPIGLDDPANLSSARDLASLAMTLRENPTFRKIVAMPSATLDSGSITRQVTSRNSLMSIDPTVDGIKTGHTLGAGYVLVASAERAGVPLISVVLGASSEAARDQESQTLLDYGYGLYQEKKPVGEGEELASAEVRFEDEPLALLADGRIAVQARDDQEIRTDVQAPGEVEGPILEGARIGRAVVTLDGERVGAVPLLAARAVAEPSIVDRIGGPVVAFLIIAGIFVIVVAGFTVLRRSRPGNGGSGRTHEERMRSRQQRTSRRSKEGPAA
jgi:D-alanyl-D-alanine carboxypeptidase (penicillin-binding protein 5/6)